MNELETLRNFKEAVLKKHPELENIVSDNQLYEWTENFLADVIENTRSFPHLDMIAKYRNGDFRQPDTFLTILVNKIKQGN